MFLLLYSNKKEEIREDIFVSTFITNSFLAIFIMQKLRFNVTFIVRDMFV